MLHTKDFAQFLPTAVTNVTPRPEAGTLGLMVNASNQLVFISEAGAETILAPYVAPLYEAVYLGEIAVPADLAATDAVWLGVTGVAAVDGNVALFIDTATDNLYLIQRAAPNWDGTFAAATGVSI